MFTFKESVKLFLIISLFMLAALFFPACQHKSRLVNQGDDKAFCKANPDQCVMTAQDGVRS